MFLTKRTCAVSISTASLADIAFLLLIFFLVTTTIHLEKGITLVLPGNETMQMREKNIAKIFVNRQGAVMLDGEIKPVREIANTARQMLQQNEKIVFAIQTDERAKYAVYIDVLDQLKRAGARRIAVR
ncbi:biopolymer transporter ExbD [candidate division KSB1 bacterium]|nr:biopolymer transporter ExbD [candidate division KSB1 bacterium]